MVGIFCFAALLVLAFGADDDGTDHLTTCLIQSIKKDALETASAPDSSCTDAWGEFDEAQPLTSTQLELNPTLPADFSHYVDLPRGGFMADNVGLFVFPEYHFAICLIPKVGSSMWADILIKMVLNDRSAADKFLWLDIAGGYKGSAEEKTAVFSDPAATRAVFVREPLSRFASAYLDKCVSEMPTLLMCPMMEIVDDGAPVTMRAAVDWMVGTDRTIVNEHWLPQSYFCELQDRVSEYTTVGLYSEENYGKDATCLMDMANISYFNSKGAEYGFSPYWEDVDTASDRPPNDYHSDTDDEEQLVLQKLFSPEGAQKLIEALANDYDTFHFPKEPAWLAGATGEWYDSVLSEPPPPPLLGANWRQILARWA